MLGSDPFFILHWIAPSIQCKTPTIDRRSDQRQSSSLNYGPTLRRPPPPRYVEQTTHLKLRDYQSNLDRGASRATEALWLIVKCVAFMPCLPLPSKLRVWVLCRFGARIGNGVVIRSQVDITFPWRLTIGDDVWIGEGVKILNLAEVTIGDDCCLSQRAFLCAGSHRFDLPNFDLVTKPIIVHDGSWITAGVFVAPGVSIGPNSMCAAGSVVLNDVPANTTVIGNPARPKDEL